MLLEIKDLYHKYMQGTPFEVAALKGINLSIAKGSFTGIIGQTGSGKSTLVQHFNGLLKPSSGKILLESQDIWKEGTSRKEVRSRVGLLFQYPEEQLFEDTVFNDVAFGIKRLGLTPQEIEEKVKTALKKVNLNYESIRKLSPFDLSGGEKRRVAMAGVLVMEPQILILDEPTAGLDPRGRREILLEIKKMHTEEGFTIILVSHSMEDIAWLTENLIVLQDGEVLLQGSPTYVFSSEEELKRAGLAVPEINRVMQGLKKMGKEVRTDIYTVEEAEKEILRVLKESNP